MEQEYSNVLLRREVISEIQRKIPLLGYLFEVISRRSLNAG